VVVVSFKVIKVVMVVEEEAESHEWVVSACTRKPVINVVAVGVGGGR